MSYWGRFHPSGIDEEHIAPCSDDGKRMIGNHTFEGVDCWCKPRRDDEFSHLIIHNDKERGGFNA